MGNGSRSFFCLKRQTNIHMKTKTTGLFASLPQKAKVLGAQFVSIESKKQFQISYVYNGLTYTQSVSLEGGEK